MRFRREGPLRSPLASNAPPGQRPDDGGGRVHRGVVVRGAPYSVEAPPDAFGALLTPAEDRFVRTNFPIPQIDRARHVVQIGGAVTRPHVLTVGELRTLPRTTATVTTECAGNHRTTLSPLPPGEPWGGGAVSTGRWSGVPLRAVLEGAGLLREAVEILFTGADQGTAGGRGEVHFARSLPLAKALEESTLLAFELDGNPISLEHGGPLRLVVPGWYGMASVKWVTRIEALTSPFEGYFQTERYVFREPGGKPSPVTLMRVKSVFVESALAVPLRPTVLRGLAWSGSGRIAKVEIAPAGGAPWQPARLVGPDLPHCWRSWEADWTPEAIGRHVLRCRATDEAGNVQPETPHWNDLGYGANGVQSLVVDVRAAAGPGLAAPPVPAPPRTGPAAEETRRG